MEITPLASSSDGNCTLLRSNGTALLIDCGVSLRVVTAAVGRDNMRSIAGLFVTHEHSDHVKGIPTLARRLPDLPVYVHDKSFRARRSLFEGANRKRLDGNSEIVVGSFRVTPFPTHHDSYSSHGFSIHDSISGLSLCYIPDTGHVCPVITEHASKADILFVECDYDVSLLASYPHYPPDLKARIAGPHGHLSNDDALDLVEAVGANRFQKVVFTHLSPRTNSPDVLRAKIRSRFGSDDRFEIAGRNGSSTMPSLGL